MLPSEDPVKRRLVVDTETPGTEITIIDSAGTMAESAVQRLEGDFTPALYKIRYRVGDRVVDQIIDLPPGEGVFTVNVPELPILSAAPFSTGTDARPDAAQYLDDLMRQPRIGMNKRSSLFIFVMRDPAPFDRSSRPEKLGTGITVHAFTGEKIGDFENAETQHECSACTIPVDPGSYILRVQRDSGRPIEQTLVAIDGWQTQFYVRLIKKCVEPEIDMSPGTALLTSGARGDLWQLDLARAGVLMIEEPPQGAPDASNMRWTAAARQALAAGRSIAAPDRTMMNALLSGKFKNPMLGIYAGHLLALQEQPDLASLREVVNTLSGMIGNHPDLTSLMIPLADTRAQGVIYAEPPMLRSSWSLILSACTPENDLRPPRSYSARISGSLWGSSAWLAWRMPTEVEGGMPSENLFRTLYAQAVSGKLTSAIRALLMSEDAKLKLTPTEVLLAQYLDVVSRQLHMAQELTSQDDQRSSLSAFYPIIRSFFDSELQKDTKAVIAGAFTPSGLTKITGLPYSSILDAASGLASKLGLTQSTSLISQVLGAVTNVLSTRKSK